MTASFLLKQFAYTIPVSSLSLKQHPPKGSSAQVTPASLVSEQVPLLNLRINFEQSTFELEANWQYLVSRNLEEQSEWNNYHSERIKFDMDIFPLSLLPDLHLPETDGLVLPLEGDLEDGKTSGSCSGLMVFENLSDKSGALSEDWIISIYLYDFGVQGFEVKLKLPILIDRHNGLYN